jgi:hypothetical protein
VLVAKLPNATDDASAYLAGLAASRAEERIATHCTILGAVTYMLAKFRLAHPVDDARRVAHAVSTVPIDIPPVGNIPAVLITGAAIRIRRATSRCRVIRPSFLISLAIRRARFCRLAKLRLACSIATPHGDHPRQGHAFLDVHFQGPKPAVLLAGI